VFSDPLARSTPEFADLGHGHDAREKVCARGVSNKRRRLAQPNCVALKRNPYHTELSDLYEISMESSRGAICRPPLLTL